MKLIEELLENYLFKNMSISSGLSDTQWAQITPSELMAKGPEQMV